MPVIKATIMSVLQVNEVERLLAAPVNHKALICHAVRQKPVIPCAVVVTLIHQDIYRKKRSVYFRIPKPVVTVNLVWAYYEVGMQV